MDITPTPAFNEAVRNVLGITDLIPGPAITIPALQDEATATKIRARHAEILDSPACQVADEMATEMQCKLDNGLTPSGIGSDDINSRDQRLIVHSEWKSWFEEEDDAGNGPIEVIGSKHTSTRQSVPDNNGEPMLVVTWREGDEEYDDSPLHLRARLLHFGQLLEEGRAFRVEDVARLMRITARVLERRLGAIL